MRGQEKPKAAEPAAVRAEAKRPRRRRVPGTWRAVGYALAVHLVLIAVLFIGLRWSSRPAPPIQAYVAEEPKAATRPPEPEVKQKDEEQRRAAEQEQEQERQRREAEAQRKVAEEKRRAEEVQRAQEEKKRIEAKRRAEEEKRRAEEEKRRAEEEKRQAEAKRRQEEAQRRKQAEQALKENLAAEERAREEAAQAARVRSQVDQYTELVRQRVSRSWSRPPGTRTGLQCTVFVRVAPGGEVLDVRISRSSGDVGFDRSVQNAVYKAVPLPVPADQVVFEAFREIEFVFHPQE
jgi:colicin import membrane protein